MHVRTPRDIGLIIKDRRRDLRMDQAELARRIGVSRQWLVQIEKGKPGAEIGLVLNALRELGLDVWLGELPDATNTNAAAVFDLNEIVERARGNRGDQ